MALAALSQGPEEQLGSKLHIVNPLWLLCVCVCVCGGVCVKRCLSATNYLALPQETLTG